MQTEDMMHEKNEKACMTLAEFSELMLDWDQRLNDGIVPSSVTSGRQLSIKWRCHKCGRVWSAPVKSRVNGSGCTCDAMERKTWKLRKRLVERDGSLSDTRPDIAKQWHPTLNGDLTPDDITEHSMFKAWWIGDDGIPWQSVVAVRCRKKGGTYRPKSLAVLGFNDLKTVRPDLAREWNYEKNRGIDITSIIPGSKRKVWWICEKGHEWEATVASRKSGRGCPLCNQERNTSFPEQATYYYVKKQFADAENRYYPEEKLEVDVYIPSYKIAIEYDGSYYHRSKKKHVIDFKKNQRLSEMGILLIRIVEEGGEAPDNTPFVISCCRVNSNVRIDDALKQLFSLLEQLTGNEIIVDIDSDRDRSLIYEQYVLSEKKNSIAVVAPEVLKEWHPTKNGKINPEYVRAMSNKVFWWKCQDCGYEWKAPPYRRAKGMGCPACTGNAVAIGINDLATVRPDLVEDWNYEKNIGIEPHEYLAGSNKKIWWRCSICSYEWETTISNRSRGNGCPKCAGKIVTEQTSLSALHPELIQEWAYDMNHEMRPEDFLSGSEKKVWWRCSKGHVWNASIVHRVNGNGCPYCGNKIVLRGFNDLATTYPELALEWDTVKNTIAPDQVLSGSNKKVWWKCKKGHSWEAAISNRIRGTGCPYCNGKKVDVGKNDLQTVYPLLAAEWNYEKNGESKPSDYLPGSNKKVWWKCNDCGGEWNAVIGSRVRGRGCPYCAGVKPTVGVNDLQTKMPELASEWNYDRNIQKPSEFMPGSRAKVWWKCNKCGYEWDAAIGSRSRGRGCPKCAGKTK